MYKFFFRFCLRKNRYFYIRLTQKVLQTRSGSYVYYCSFVLAQNCRTIERILILQKKAFRIINFQPTNSHTSPLFKQSSILKFQDKICLENILFLSKSLNIFNFSSDQRNYETSSSTQDNLVKLFNKTNRFGNY